MLPASTWRNSCRYCFCCSGVVLFQKRPRQKRAMPSTSTVWSTAFISAARLSASEPGPLMMPTSRSPVALTNAAAFSSGADDCAKAGVVAANPAAVSKWRNVRRWVMVDQTPVAVPPLLGGGLFRLREPDGGRLAGVVLEFLELGGPVLAVEAAEGRVGIERCSLDLVDRVNQPFP